MNDILAQITTHKLACLAKDRQETSLKHMEDLASRAPKVRGFANALRQNIEDKDIAIIAELKKASPSKGLIREDFEPMALARMSQKGGASALSVLTDERFFQGSLDNLVQARKASTLPLLRKDFIFDIWQIAQARAFGADAVLLIMANLSLEKAQQLANYAQTWQMDVLPEIHSEAEMEKALALDSALIGINNRDLTRFTTDLSITKRLAPLLPKDRLIICESGIHKRDDIENMRDFGVQCFLIGEALMKQSDIIKALHQLLNRNHQ